MKTGIIRRIDDLGRVVIPKEIRNKLNIKEGDPLEISVEGDKVCFEKYIASYEYGKYLSRFINRIMSDDATSKNLKVISLLEQARAIFLSNKDESQ